MGEASTRLYGIIHIGSVHMSLHILSFTSMDDMRLIERVSKETGYGEEVFQTRQLSFESIDEICRILLGFRQLLRDYGVDDVQVVGTTAVREARNRLNLIDQVRIRTGFSIIVVDMTKEIYYKFFALYYRVLLKDVEFAGAAVLLMDITSGGLGLTGWQEGRLLFQQNVHSGSLRILENFDKNQRNELAFPSAVREYIHGMLSPLWANVRQYNVKYVILSGMEARIIAGMLGMELHQGSCLLQPRRFLDFVHSFDGVTPFKLMQRYGLSESRANVIMPTILLYYEMLRVMEVDSLILTGTTFLEGYSLYYGAERKNLLYLRNQRQLILQLAHTIAEKYQCNRAHSERVEQYSVILFQAMHRLHGLQRRHGYLLRLAAILHETGKFINLRHHNIYTYQIVMGTDIFGISNEEKEIVANIGYYYYKGIPSDKDENYRRLTVDQKMVVNKLTAIFRLANALDQGHSGKISHIDAVLDRRELVVSYAAEEDVSLVRWTFEKVSSFFTEVFGISPVLRKD